VCPSGYNEENRTLSIPVDKACTGTVLRRHQQRSRCDGRHLRSNALGFAASDLRTAASLTVPAKAFPCKTILARKRAMAEAFVPLHAGIDLSLPRQQRGRSRTRCRKGSLLRPSRFHSQPNLAIDNSRVLARNDTTPSCSNSPIRRSALPTSTTWPLT